MGLPLRMSLALGGLPWRTTQPSVPPTRANLLSVSMGTFLQVQPVRNFKKNMTLEAQLSKDGFEVRGPSSAFYTQYFQIIRVTKLTSNSM